MKSKHITTFLILMAFIAAFASAGYAAGDATVTKDFLYRAAEGLLPNSEVHDVKGVEQTSSAGYYVFYPKPYQTVYPWPATAATMEVASTSATDTGAAVVTVKYIDTNWDAQEEDVTLNGQTEVSMSEPAIRVNELVMKTPAAGQTSNVGVISCANGATWTSGVPDTNVLAVMKAAEGKSSGVYFSVPRNKNAVYGAMHAIKPSTDTAEIYIYSRSFGGAFIANEHAIIRDVAYVETSHHKLEEKSDLYMTFRGQNTSNDTHFAIEYYIKEEQ